MAEAADRLESLVAQVGVVLAEHARRPHHLVDAGRGRERGDVAAELRLERDRQAEGDADRVAWRRASSPPTCQKCGSSSRAVAPSACRVDGAEPLGEDAEAAAAEDLAGVVARLLEVLGAIDEQVGDRERWVPGERRVVSACPHLLGPDPARDVDQDSAAVALAVDVPGAMEHLL